VYICCFITSYRKFLFYIFRLFKRVSAIFLAKYGCDRSSSFHNMKVSIFGMFGMKTPIHSSEIWILERFDPLNGVHY